MKKFLIPQSYSEDRSLIELQNSRFLNLLKNKSKKKREEKALNKIRSIVHISPLFFDIFIRSKDHSATSVRRKFYFYLFFS